MSLDHHAPHDHAPRALGARRDLLGLGALLGPDSGLVPISDLDAGAEWPSACGDDGHDGEHGAGAPDLARGAAHGALPTVCGSCSTRCATVELALGRAVACETEQKP